MQEISYIYPIGVENIQINEKLTNFVSEIHQISVAFWKKIAVNFHKIILFWPVYIEFYHLFKICLCCIWMLFSECRLWECSSRRTVVIFPVIVSSVSVSGTPIVAGVWSIISKSFSQISYSITLYSKSCLIWHALSQYRQDVMKGL